jgi:hypothetical protein
VFWNYSLKYTFPKEILKPINDVYSGVLRSVKKTFKLKKSSNNSQSARNVIQTEQPQRTPQISNPEIRSVE